MKPPGMPVRWACRMRFRRRRSSSLGDLARDADVVDGRHVDQEAAGQRDVRGDARALLAQRLLGDLNDDLLAFLQQIGDGRRARRRGLWRSGPDASGVAGGSARARRGFQRFVAPRAVFGAVPVSRLPRRPPERRLRLRGAARFVAAALRRASCGACGATRGVARSVRCFPRTRSCQARSPDSPGSPRVGSAASGARLRRRGSSPVRRPRDASSISECSAAASSALS